MDSRTNAKEASKESGRDRNIKRGVGFRPRAPFRVESSGRHAFRIETVQPAHRGSRGATRNVRGIPKKSHLTYNWSVSESKRDAGVTDRKGMPLVFNGFNGQTVFNYKFQQQKMREREHINNIETGTESTDFQTSTRGFNDRGRGRGGNRAPSAKRAKISELDMSGDKAEVYDFSHFSAKDFEKPRGGMRNRGGTQNRGRSRGTRGRGVSGRGKLVAKGAL